VQAEDLPTPGPEVLRYATSVGYSLLDVGAMGLLEVTATRRRGEALELTIREAVLSDLSNRGYPGTTYESIAVRAGTSKTVLYRRWPAKAEMVMAAILARHTDTYTALDTGSLDGDIKDILRGVRTSFLTIGRKTMLMLMAELDHSSGEAMRTLLFSRGTSQLETALERARGRGELGTGMLPPRLLSLPFDLVRNELAVSGRLDDDGINGINGINVPLLTLRSRSG
jgi:AcrR family transcriptional regulator